MRVHTHTHNHQSINQCFLLIAATQSQLHQCRLCKRPHWTAWTHFIVRACKNKCDGPRNSDLFTKSCLRSRTLTLYSSATYRLCVSQHCLFTLCTTIAHGSAPSGHHLGFGWQPRCRTLVVDDRQIVRPCPRVHGQLLCHMELTGTFVTHFDQSIYSNSLSTYLSLRWQGMSGIVCFSGQTGNHKRTLRWKAMVREC